MASWPQWLHRVGSPREFYRLSGRALPWLALAAAGVSMVGLVWGLAFAPPDARQGHSFRIAYLHVPVSFLALAGYYLMALAGGVGLVWRVKLAHMTLRAAARVGAAFTFVALLTGALWGKPTWGTYWVWDARITSMLILFFLSLGVIALGQAYRGERADRAAAVLALVGTVNVPIIYKSVDWWYTLHQPATIKLTGTTTMHPAMLHPLLMCIAGFYLFYALLLVLHVRAEILAGERRTRWVRALALGERG